MLRNLIKPMLKPCLNYMLYDTLLFGLIWSYETNNNVNNSVFSKNNNNCFIDETVRLKNCENQS